MSTTTIAKARSFVAVIAVAATLAACGSSDGGGSSRDAGASTTGSPMTSPTSESPTTEPTEPMESTESTESTDSTKGTEGTPATGETVSTEPTPSTETAETTPSTDVTPSTNGPTVSAGGARPLVQYTVQGMFPVTPPFLGNGPQTVIYDDGTILVSFRGNFAAQPQVWPYEVGHLDPSDVTALLDSARDRGLLTDPAPYPSTDVVDPPRTTLVLDTPGGVFTHVADGLLGDEADPRRLSLQQFIGEVASLTMKVDAASPFYEPTQLAIVATPTPEDGPASASTSWPDGSVRLADATECTVVSDRAAVELLNGGLAGGRYVQDGVSYVVTSRILPEGTTCR